MTSYGDDQVRAAKDGVRLEDLFGAYTKPKKAGADFVACCPFHQERTPSLHIYPDQQRYYCFGCKAEGDAIKLVQEKESLSFVEAVEHLARLGGVTLVPQGGAAVRRQMGQRATFLALHAWAAEWYAAQLWSPAGAQALGYLVGRGFSEATLREFGIGWSPGHGELVAAAQAAGYAVSDLVALDLAVERDGRLRDRFFERVMIPITSRTGSPIAFQGRILPAAEAAAKAAGRGVGKYVNSMDTPLYRKSSALFSHHRALRAVRGARRLFVLEGPLDAMAAWQAGVPEAVATCGTALTEDHARELERLLSEDARLIIAFDGDAAGRTQSVVALTTCLAQGLLPELGSVAGGKDLGQIQEDSGAPAVLAAIESMSCLSTLPAIVSAVKPEPSADTPRLLRAADEAIAILSRLPDRHLAELWLPPLSEALTLPLRVVRDRFKSTPAAGTEAPAARSEAEPDRSNRYAAMVRTWIAHVESGGSKPDAMCGWLTADGQTADTSDGEMMMRFSHRQRLSGQDIVDIELKTATTITIQDWRDARRQTLIGSLLGRPASDAGKAELRKWLRALTGAERPLDIAVMTHWIWLVKRRAAGLPVSWDIIPVLEGGQGVGKSVALERLCAPLSELSFPIDATAITDERKSLVLTRALVGRLEEMAGMAKADMEKLKAIATANLAVFRELFTMSVQQRRRTCNFIASSNLPLDAIVLDTTGVRRFFQIHCAGRDWDLMNSIDNDLIWQCVSESDAPPINDCIGAIREAQAAAVHRDLVSLWLRSDDWDQLVIRRADSTVPVVIKAYKPNEGHSLDDLLARCAYWCRASSQVPPIITRFRLRLAQEGVAQRKVRIPGHPNPVWRYFLPDRFLPFTIGSNGQRIDRPDDRFSDLGGDDTPALDPTPVPISIPVRDTDLPEGDDGFP